MILNLKCCDNYNEIYIPMDTKSSMGLLILELWASVGVHNLMVLMDSYTWVHVLLQFLLIFLYILSKKFVFWISKIYQIFCLLTGNNNKCLHVKNIASNGSAKRYHLYLTSPAAETYFLL